MKFDLDKIMTDLEQTSYDDFEDPDENTRESDTYDEDEQ